MRQALWFICIVVSLIRVNMLTADESAFVEFATERLREATEVDGSGVAVLVARDGEIVFQGGFGLADVENKIPITTETKFRIGSVSKQFTAIAILKLVEEEKLTLDDSLAKFSPDFPGGDSITIRHLLTHTSGIKSYTDKPDFLARVAKAIQAADLIASFQNDPPDFAPGAGFHYNNSAYFLLGEIIAKVSGQSYGDYLKAALFEPIGMQATGVYDNSAPPASAAKGYSYEGDEFVPALDWDMSWAGGAGALYSTVGDLYLWNEALYGGKVLSDDLFKMATTPIELPPDVDGMNYGFGLVIAPIHRLPAICHGGGLNGWASDLLRFPEQRCTIVVLGNALPPPPKLSPSAISRELARKLLEAEINAAPVPTEDSSVDPSLFADYIGRYDYVTAVMTVTMDGEALFAQLTDQPKFQIFPKAKDHFFWKITDAEVQFVRDENLKVVAARHRQGGNAFRAAKLDDSVALTEEQAERYVGRYRYGLFSVMTVTRDGTQLFAQLTAQPKYPIFPKSEFEFEWHVVEASVKFELGEDGEVAKAVHTQNGTSFDARKIK